MKNAQLSRYPLAKEYMPEMTLSLILRLFKIYLYPNTSSGFNINAKKTNLRQQL